jgi:hypothetical protein
MKNLPQHVDLPRQLLTSLLIAGIHMGAISDVFHIRTVTFNYQNLSFIHDYPMTLFVGMLG